MNLNDLLFYGVMEQERFNDAIENFNTRWKRLCDIQIDLADRFVDKALHVIDDEDRTRLMSHVEQVILWQKDINERLDIAEDKHLSTYAMHLRNTSLLALKLCKSYKVYDDIKSFSYSSSHQMIKLNDENLYFLG